MTVSRETLRTLTDRHGLGASAAEPLWALMEGLERESDPPTTLRAPQEVLDGHLADSLAALELPELARASHIADIGAGAGFPGLALAAALPSSRVDLIEASAKKCAVMERLARAARLSNVRVIAVRAEEWAAADGSVAYDAVTARAVAPLSVLVEYAAPLLRERGALVAWKGARDPGEEAAGASAAEQLGMRRARVEHVRPFEGARERHLHVYLKVAPTPSRFPRRIGVARKRPLA